MGAQVEAYRNQSSSRRIFETFFMDELTPGLGQLASPRKHYSSRPTAHRRRFFVLIFLDTEYTDPLNCDLISIGMVSEDGQHELYLERSDYEHQWRSSFVHANVLLQLGNAGPAVDRQQLAAQLTMWFSTLPRSVTIACDSVTDWNLLLNALDDVRPSNLTDRYDLRGHIDSSVFHHAVVRYHERNGPWHHALHDARAHRHGWLAWHDSKKAIPK
jgi:3' exoribonuclease, RNase T-like